MENIWSTNLDGEHQLIKDVVKLDRFVCTKDNPWSREKCLYGIHPDAIIYPQAIPGDSGIIRNPIEGFKCPNCNHMWYEYYDYVHTPHILKVKVDEYGWIGEVCTSKIRETLSR
jgi:hypothetical protein